MTTQLKPKEVSSIFDLEGTSDLDGRVSSGRVKKGDVVDIVHKHFPSGRTAIYNEVHWVNFARSRNVQFLVPEGDLVVIWISRLYGLSFFNGKIKLPYLNSEFIMQDKEHPQYQQSRDMLVQAGLM